MKTDNSKLKICDMLQKKTIDLNCMVTLTQSPDIGLA